MAKKERIKQEDILSYAQFPKMVINFFEKSSNKKYSINECSDIKNKVHPV